MSEDLLEGLAQSVAMFTLIDGARSAREAKDVLAVTPRLHVESQIARDKMFDLLRRLYPREGGVDGLRPDLLGERFVRSCIARDEEVLEVVLGSDRTSSWTHSTLTILTRIAKHGEDKWLRRALREGSLTIPLVERAMEVAVEVGDPLGPILAEAMRTAGQKYQGIVNHISGRIPAKSVALSELAAMVLTRRLNFLTEKVQHGNKSATDELIDCSLKLADVLHRNGEAEDALHIINQALITSESPRLKVKMSAFVRAQLLSSLGTMLGVMGQAEEAVLMAGQAESALRGLAAVRPDVYRPGWATCLDNLGLRLLEIGRFDEALPRAEEAERIRRELAAARPDVYRPDWATSLVNLGVHLREVGRYDEALARAEEAERIYRDLAAAQPDAHRAEWAKTLANLGSMLRDVGRYDEALARAEEAEPIRRDLAAARPDAFRPDWAASLRNLGAHLGDVGRYDEALAKIEEAERIYRELAVARPDAYRSDWAATLVNLGALLGAVGLHDEALAKAEEAERIHRDLAAARPDAYRSAWATSLGNLSYSLLAMARYRPALAAAEQSLAVFCDLAERRPGHRYGFAAELGWIRTLMAQALLRTGQTNAAMAHAELALAALDTVKGIRPAESAPRQAASLAILALRPVGDKPTSAGLAREALDLIAPHFYRRGKGLKREMELVINALRETGQTVPPDVLSRLNEYNSAPSSGNSMLDTRT